MIIFWDWLRTDFWDFFRSFLYGSIGGFSSIIMSYAVNESSLVNAKNKIQFSSFRKEYVENLIAENRKRSNRFYFKMTFIHIFIGGISGMIAVSAFNPNANELQTFSIAAIAGLSGFAFLKRSALIDDPEANNLMKVEIDAIAREARQTTGNYDELKADLVDAFDKSIDKLIVQTPIPRTSVKEKDLDKDIKGTDTQSEAISEILKLLGEDAVQAFYDLKETGFPEEEILKILNKKLDEISS